MAKTEKLQWLVLIVVVGFTCAVIFHYIHPGKPGGYPYNTFLFTPTDRFRDLYNPLRGSADLDPYNPGRISYIGGYFPFGYLLAFLLSLIKPKLLALLVFLGSFVVYLGVYLAYSVYGTLRVNGQQATQVFALTAMTYPVLFLLDRANFDAIVFVLLSLFLVFYQRRQTVLSAIALAGAIAMKGYPALLLPLYLADRRYREFILACVASALLTIGSLALFKDGLFLEFQKMVVSFQRASTIAFGSGSLIRFNSSLYTAILFTLSRVWPGASASVTFNLGYMAVAAVAFSVTCYIICRNNLAPWERMLLLVTLMILLPQSSGDYRLVMLYVPMVGFLTSSDSGNRSGDLGLTLTFALLLIPKAYYVIQNDVNIGLLINPLLLVVLWATTVRRTAIPRESIQPSAGGGLKPSEGINQM